MQLSQNAIEWLANGERGLSSETIFTYLTGVNALSDRWATHPCDPADLRRCRLLLEACPELIPKFPTMAKSSPVWKSLVENWLALCALMDAECPNWRDTNSRWSAPLTYHLMKFVGCQSN